MKTFLHEKLTDFNGFSRPDSENSDRLIHDLNVLLLKVVDEKQNGQNALLHADLMNALRAFINGGEPCMDAKISWAYPVFTGIMAVMRQTPTIWNAFTEEEQKKFATIMKCCAVITAFISRDKNGYKTGIGLLGNCYKDWNPNIQIPLVVPMIFCMSFFGGADNVDELLQTFDYDSCIKEMKAFGFSHMLSRWTTEAFTWQGHSCPGARELLMDGGTAYIKVGGNVFLGGTGIGVRHPYLYNEKRDAAEILTDLLVRNYSGGIIKSTVERDGYVCTVLDGTQTPYEGEDGMMFEMAGGGKEFRCDTSHAFIDFFMLTAVIYAAEAVDLWYHNEHIDLWKKICAGNNDLLYKIAHGWHCVDRGLEYDAVNNISEAGTPMLAVWKKVYQC